MTPQQFAAMKPCDVALVRAEILPRGHRGNAGDHVEVRVGHTTFFAPLADVVGVLHTAEIENLKVAGCTVPGSASDDGVIAALCGPHGRKIAA